MGSNDRITIPQIKQLITDYVSVKGNEIGGSLHLVYDGNVRNKDIDLCIEYARSKNDFTGALIARLLKKNDKNAKAQGESSFRWHGKLFEIIFSISSIIYIPC